MIERENSTQVARMTERVPSGLRPHREAVRFFLYRDAFHGSRGGIDNVNGVIVATRQPKHFSINADVTHVRAATAWNGPIIYDFACGEVYN
jgi:hypothetical protein